MLRQKIQLLNIYVKDMKKIATGFTAFFRNCLSNEKISTSLSQFYSHSMESEIGKPNNYEVIIVNNTPQPEWVSLLIDIYFMGSSLHRDGHHSYFEKKIFLSNREKQKIKFCLKPDIFWQGELPVPGKHLLSAFLVDKEGRPFDQLSLIQYAT
jgi:hypothetical protein